MLIYLSRIGRFALYFETKSIKVLVRSKSYHYSLLRFLAYPTKVSIESRLIAKGKLVSDYVLKTVGSTHSLPSLPVLNTLILNLLASMARPIIRPGNLIILVQIAYKKLESLLLQSIGSLASFSEVLRTAFPI